MIAINIVNAGSMITTFVITSSPRDETFVFRAGYLGFASSHCPEFTGDFLYVHGESRSNDGDLIEIPTEFVPKLMCAIAEVNFKKFNIPSPVHYDTCCDHFYLSSDDCQCNYQSCKICGATNNRRDMREIVSGDETYYICKSHKKTIKCTICNEKVYFIVPHHAHSELQVCPDCRTAYVCYGTQHSYSHKPVPLFHDMCNNEVKIYSFDDFQRNKKLQSRYWTGHEVEQQFPYESNRGILIGKMQEKQGEFIYCKHDGSIGNGTECVTHPFSWEFFKKHDWDGILNHHVVDWRASGNQVGHHTHININAFTRMHLFKFLKFHHTHLKWVEFIAQRRLQSYCRATGGAIQKALNKGVNCEKYEFIHATRNTIEWRAFGSPITIEEFKKNNEYLHAAFNWTRDTSLKNLTPEHLLLYIQKHKREYPNLLVYIASCEGNHPQRFEKNKEADYHQISTTAQRAANRAARHATQVQFNCRHCGGSFIGESYEYDSHLYCSHCFSDLFGHEYDDEEECDSDEY